MEASKNYGDEPAGKDLGVVLFLVVACPFGLLSWVGLFSAIRWSVLAVWSVMVGMLPNPVTIATTPAIPSGVPVPVAASRSDPSASFLRIPHRLPLGTPG
jgi:hypothetical protein